MSKQFYVARSIEYPNWHNEVWIEFDNKSYTSEIAYSPAFTSFQQAHLFFTTRMECLERLLEPVASENRYRYNNLVHDLDDCKTVLMLLDNILADEHINNLILNNSNSKNSIFSYHTAPEVGYERDTSPLTSMFESEVYV